MSEYSTSMMEDMDHGLDDCDYTFASLQKMKKDDLIGIALGMQNLIDAHDEINKQHGRAAGLVSELRRDIEMKSLIIDALVEKLHNEKKPRNR